MRTNKILIVFLSMFLVLTMGCGNGIKNEGNKIIVEKQVGEKSKYESFNEVKDSEAVKSAKKILNGISWKNAKVDMAYPSEYRFHFEDDDSKTSGVVYDLWISPNKTQVELVVDSEGKYIQLDEDRSAELFEIITGEKLGNDQ